MALFWAVSLLSAAALAFEVLLMRLFSIAQWHHFAYMIISLALLGYGASGTVLCFLRSRLLRRFPLAFAAAAGHFGLTAPAGFAVAQWIPLNSLEIVWDRGQQAYLLGVTLILAVPFFCAATAIGLALSMPRARIEVIYRSDLVGAALGASGIVGALFVFTPATCLVLIGAAGLAAAALGTWHESVRRVVPAALLVAAVALPVVWPAGWSTPRPSPYKELSLALTVPDARVVAERSSPLGWLSVVESPTIPFRHAPGLSLNATGEPPSQFAVFTDGSAMTAITRFDGRTEPLAYLDHQSAALPYHLVEAPRVLVLGSGGGADVLLARLHQARTVDAVEINPQMAALVDRDFADFAGHLFEAPGVRLHTAEARSFVARTKGRFDLIQVALLDSFSAASAGLHALNESTLYTVEAFQTYISKLAPGGILAITRWLKVPPRDSLKLFATAVEALARQEVTEPGRHLALIRSWRTSTLLVKKGPLVAADVAAIRHFCRERSFDVAHLPGMTAAEANRYNVLERPYLHIGATALLGPAPRRFIDDYMFDVAPTTDERPYFFQFLKWRTLIELLREPVGGLHLVEWGYLILLAALVQAVPLGAFLVLLPMPVLRPEATTAPGRGRVAVYFLTLGLAFLFVEIAFIQRFVLFLGHPLYAVALVLASFLAFAGLGSGCTGRLRRWLGDAAGRAMGLAVAAIGVLALVYLVGLPAIFERLLGLPEAARVAAAVLLVAPLAFFMGIPFPLGLAHLAERAPSLIPWAWGINGCASVLSAILATLLAVHLGFSAVIVLAVALYGLAALAFAGRW